MTNSLGSQVAKASSWLFITRLVITLLSMSSIFIMARLLTPADFGLVALASVIATMLQSMVQIPVSQALIAIDKPEKSHFDTAFTINILRTLAILVVLLALAVPAANFYNEPKVTAIIIVFSIAAFASGFTNPKFVTFEKSLNFTYLFFTNTLSKILAIGVSLLIAYYTQSYWALVIGSIITQILNVMFTYCFLPYRPSFTLNKHKEILSFSIWVSLSHVINNVNWKFDQLLIGKFFSTATLGIFNVGNELASLPTSETATPLNRALFPAFSKIINEPKRFRNAYISSVSIFYSLLLPIGFGLAVLSEPLILLMLGEKWIEAAVVLQLLGGMYAVTCIASTTKAIAMAQGRTQLIFKRDLLFLIIKIVFSLVGFYLFGFLGILYSKLINAVVLVTYNFFLVRYLLDLSIKRQMTALSRPILSVVTMVFTLMLTGHQVPHNIETLSLILYLLSQLIIGALVYCLTHFFLWVVLGKPIGIEQRLVIIINKIFKRARA